MRIALVSVLVLAAMVGFPMVSAATEFSQFEGRVGKSAPKGLDVTPPVVCICKGSGGLHNHAGKLSQTLTIAGSSQFVNVFCEVLGFSTSNGEANNSVACLEWELLPK
jgi:hypothetical protein